MTDAKLAFGVEPSYGRYPLRLARYKALAESIRSRLAVSPRPGGRLRLLDVGVGHGRTRRYLGAEGVALDTVAFHGLDVSPERLERVSADGGWALCRGDLEADLPYASAAFDVVVCEQVLEHLHRPRPALREMRRVLRPGGLLVVGAPSFSPPLALLRGPAMRLRDLVRTTDDTHFQTFTARSLRRAVEAEGYRVREVRGFRVIDGGVLRRLGDQAWWYRLNRRVGRHLPGLCIEIQVVATAPAAEPGVAGSAPERGRPPSPGGGSGAGPAGSARGASHFPAVSAIPLPRPGR